MIKLSIKSIEPYAYILENEYVKVTLLPSIGGKINGGFIYH